MCRSPLTTRLMDERADMKAGTERAVDNPLIHVARKCEISCAYSPRSSVLVNRVAGLAGAA
eukprot:COSAG05_NODE_12372_length_470_cov_1.663073_1_plen_60_part_01